ncbi:MULTISPECIES: hypothetical protein [unclassified Yoonia]|uniref:hypothetical protein n=1 Tax=unclassified Yoonia TaxID=2629118 RepID=UPI002B002330|nr:MULTISPECIES: hypothetical protein [unclassified Yoonia]
MEGSSLVPVLVGGAISLVSSVVILSLGLLIESKRKGRAAKSEAALQAFVGLNKLMMTINSIENIAKHIDREFEGATKGGVTLEPASILRPLIGAMNEIDLVTPHEMLFLATGDGELPAAIQEIQHRARNLNVIIAEYNLLRREHDDFLERNAKIGDLDGTNVGYTLSGKARKISKIKIGRLNVLVAGIIEMVEEDRKTVFDVTNEYLAKAREHFGNDFPAKALEIRASGKRSLAL